MGNDGGTIPKRNELVRLKKKKEQKDKDSELSFRWRHCNITQEPLEEPIVACGLGRLYKKQAVIEALLDRSILPPKASHIKSIKDVCNLRLTPNPAFKADAEKGDGYVDRATSPYICPLTGLEVTGRFRFVYLWTCGCVFAERAMKEVKTKTCLKCQKPFTEGDVIILNGSEEEVDGLCVRMEARQARLKAEKKAKSEAKRNLKAESQVSEAGPSQPSSSASSSAATSSSAASTSSELKGSLPTESVKLPNNPKLVPKAASSSKLTIGAGSKLLPGDKRSATDKLNDPAFKKSRDSYNVASDPKASEVFKSLFTSHKTHQKQDRAHWVTYNPFYN